MNRRSAKNAGLGELETLTDARLAAEVEQALDALSPRARRWTLAVAGGTAYGAAAAEAGFSTGSAPISRLKRRADLALRLLREQTRRASLLTREGAIERFRQLSEEARIAKDYSAAARALREACLLANLYPDARLQVDHRLDLGEVTEAEWLALATLRHHVRGQLPAASAVVEAHATPLGEALAAGSFLGDKGVAALNIADSRRTDGTVEQQVTTTGNNGPRPARLEPREGSAP